MAILEGKVVLLPLPSTVRTAAEPVYMTSAARRTGDGYFVCTRSRSTFFITHNVSCLRQHAENTQLTEALPSSPPAGGKPAVASAVAARSGEGGARLTFGTHVRNPLTEMKQRDRIVSLKNARAGPWGTIRPGKAAGLRIEVVEHAKACNLLCCGSRS